MKTINYNTIVSSIAHLCIQACTVLPDDIKHALEDAAVKETSERGQSILKQCVENARIARTDNTPLCQDTGFAVFFVTMGTDVSLDHGTIVEAINEGTAQGYTQGYLRKSIVSDPLFDRKNTADNTPAIVHLTPVSGDSVTITLAPKGGGSENMSATAMLKPSDGEQGVVDFVVTTVVQAGGNPCPPTIVGVGIGGTIEHCALCAKKALLRPLGTVHTDPRYASLETTIRDAINASGVGPQGLGGKTTALAVHIETFPCHIASLPVVVALNCHAARHATIVL
jgi:fumarate hydratase subunit alpha